MTFESLLLDIDRRGVAWLTLNRPDKHNAFNEIVIGEINEALRHIDNDSRVRALVLQANGKSFSAGADLDWMRRMADYDFTANVYDAGELARMLHALNTLRLPTIAKVNGAAYGGGVGLVACCDLVLATSNAKFCLSEVKLGLVPATISPYVVAAVGERNARRLFLTAEIFGAEQAQQFGLITRLVAEAQLDAELEVTLELLLKNSPAAMASAKELLFAVANRPIDSALMEYTCTAIAKARDSAQGREGVRAFLEKRQPSWIAQD